MMRTAVVVVLLQLGLGSCTPESPPPAAAANPKTATGQCLSESQVQRVIGGNQADLRSACWTSNPTPMPEVSVDAALTIGPGGDVSSATATGDEPSVVQCVERESHGWLFPPMGCAQRVEFSLRFVREGR
jgi:hypothetical protein